ncbi:MAG: GMC family oxidoreductase [Steroidobacteraceae bacterium]
MKTLPKTDVVIVGLGAAGGVAADVLTAAGLKVIGLEAGPYLTSKDFVKQLDELHGWSGRNRLGDIKFNREIPTWRPDTITPAIPSPVVWPMMNAVGGASIHYATLSWRFRPDDFNIRTGTIRRYGEAAIPADAALADWPVNYDELEPYYDKVEYAIGVSGKGGSNPFEGPRRRDYPMPPLRPSGYARLAEKAMRALGYHPFPQPSAINSVNYDGRAACSYCGFCAGFGCWNDSKSSTLVTAIRRAEATGRLEVRPLSTVTRILTNDQGQTTGVHYVDASGETYEQPARFVILSSYVYENVRRLLLSRSDYFPNGLSNNHGQVGKYYMSHAYVGVMGLFPGLDLNAFNGAGGQSVVIDDFNGDAFDHSGLNFIRGATINAATTNLPIAAANTHPPDVPGWGPGYKDWLQHGARSVGPLYAQVETLPYHSNFLDLDPTHKDFRGEPLVRVTYNHYENEKRAGQFIADKLTQIIKKMGASQSWLALPTMPIPVNTHAYGGTRMGHDPATSVVNAYSISHEVPNLAILGGSTFVSTTGYNPTETIQALSWRAAEHIAQHFDALAV